MSIEESSIKWAFDLLGDMIIGHIDLRQQTDIFKSHQNANAFNKASEDEITIFVKRICGLLTLIDNVVWSFKSHNKGEPKYYAMCSRRGMSIRKSESNAVIRSRDSERCSCRASLSFDSKTREIQFRNEHSASCKLLSEELKQHSGRPSLSAYASRCIIPDESIDPIVSKLVTLKQNDVSMSRKDLSKQIGDVSKVITVSDSFKKSILRQTKALYNSNVSVSESFKELLSILKNNGSEYSILSDIDETVIGISFCDHLIAPEKDENLTVVFSDVTYGISEEKCGFVKTSMWSAYIAGYMKPLGLHL
jgi:hypothetical protein